jgi:hypothetical protein
MCRSTDLNSPTPWAFFLRSLLTQAAHMLPLSRRELPSMRTRYSQASALRVIPLGTSHQAVYSYRLERVIMAGTIEEALLSVWRQVMVADFAVVVLDGRSWLVKRTASRRLRQVDFQFDGENIRGLEQNPAKCIFTGSRVQSDSPSSFIPTSRNDADACHWMNLHPTGNELTAQGARCSLIYG